MSNVLKKEIKKSIRCSWDSLVFRWRVIMQGGYAARSLIVINQRFIHVGEKVKIKKGYRIECYPQFAGVQLHPSIIFEDGVIVGDHLTIFGGATVRVGKNSIFAGNVTLISENHGMDPESETPYHAQPLSTGDVIIGEGCWLGQNVCVLPNVTIGKKCVIATSSVVTHDIPDYCIAAGIPAKIVKRYNFSTNRWDKYTE